MTKGQDERVRLTKIEEEVHKQPLVRQRYFSHKDLYKIVQGALERVSSGSLRDLLIRMPTSSSHKDLCKKMQVPLTEYWIRISKEFSDEHLYKNLLDTISTQELDASFAREFTTKTRMDMSQEPFCARTYRKNTAATDSDNGNAQGHVTRAILHQNLQENATPDQPPDQTLAFTFAVITPQCGHTVEEKATDLSHRN